MAYSNDRLYSLEKIILDGSLFGQTYTSNYGNWNMETERRKITMKRMKKFYYNKKVNK